MEMTLKITNGMMDEIVKSGFDGKVVEEMFKEWDINVNEVIEYARVMYSATNYKFKRSAFDALLSLELFAKRKEVKEEKEISLEEWRIRAAKKIFSIHEEDEEMLSKMEDVMYVKNEVSRKVIARYPEDWQQDKKAIEEINEITLAAENRDYDGIISECGDFVAVMIDMAGNLGYSGNVEKFEELCMVANGVVEDPNLAIDKMKLLRKLEDQMNILLIAESLYSFNFEVPGVLSKDLEGVHIALNEGILDIDNLKRSFGRWCRLRKPYDRGNFPKCMKELKMLVFYSIKEVM